MTTKLATIMNHLNDVTPEMIGRAHKCFEGSKAFYMLENLEGKLDDEGQILEYKVWYEGGYFFCQCPAGVEGFAHVTHHSGVCVHCRIAVAAAAEEKSALAEQVRLNAQPVAMYTDQDSATVKRVMASKGQPVKRGSALPASKPFSMMR
jgi:hypothetical protein